MSESQGPGGWDVSTGRTSVPSGVRLVDLHGGEELRYRPSSYFGPGRRGFRLGVGLLRRESEEQTSRHKGRVERGRR